MTLARPCVQAARLKALATQMARGGHLREASRLWWGSRQGCPCALQIASSVDRSPLAAPRPLRACSSYCHKCRSGRQWRCRTNISECTVKTRQI